MKIDSLISAHVQDLQPYEPPDWEGAAARAGLAPDHLIRMDANENLFGPSPNVAAALARFDAYGFYPDYRALTVAVAEYAAVEPAQVVLGNGGDEIIDLAIRLFCERGSGVIVCPPAFSMYATCTVANHCQVQSIPRRDDFSIDVPAIEALFEGASEDGRPGLLILTSPGNPDGLAVSQDAIRRLLRLPLAVVVDEAYVEFGGETIVPLLDTHANLLILRSFSKWAGMAGLRLGYALGTPEVAAMMARLRPPYNVNSAAVVAALATLDDMAYVQSTIARTVSERERLRVAFGELSGVNVVPGLANFLLIRLKERSGREVASALAQKGILVRSFSDPSLSDALRITIGRPGQNDVLLEALGCILRGEDAAQVSLPSTADEPRTPGPATRHGSCQRKTRETAVSVSVHLDGTGAHQIETGLGFLDHMLAQVAAHGLFDLTVRATGDLHVDDHHTVEDVAICLGQAFGVALADRAGIARMGHAYAPMDEALARVAIDLSGRPYAVVDVEFGGSRIGVVDSDLIIHFIETLASHASLTLHAQVLCGRNDHHKAEALFKALGRALDAASRLDPRRQGVASTKGVL
jgi:histidinol-phosphate aminotransferase